MSKQNTSAENITTLTSQQNISAASVTPTKLITMSKQNTSAENITRLTSQQIISAAITTPTKLFAPVTASAVSTPKASVSASLVMASKAASSGIDFSSPGPAKVPRLQLDSPFKSPVQRLEALADDINFSYAQYVAGSRALLELHPPQTKAASMLINKGEQVISNKIGQLKYIISNTVGQTLHAKDQTIAYLRQQIESLQKAFLLDTDFDDKDLEDTDRSKEQRTVEHESTDSAENTKPNEPEMSN